LVWYKDHVADGADGIGTCHFIATALVEFVADAKSVFNPGFVAAHGGQFSPVNSS
jgi:hypothetical protein